MTRGSAATTHLSRTTEVRPLVDRFSDLTSTAPEELNIELFIESRPEGSLAHAHWFQACDESRSFESAKVLVSDLPDVPLCDRCEFTELWVSPTGGAHVGAPIPLLSVLAVLELPFDHAPTTLAGVRAVRKASTLLAAVLPQLPALRGKVDHLERLFDDAVPGVLELHDAEVALMTAELERSWATTSSASRWGLSSCASQPTRHLPGLPWRPLSCSSTTDARAPSPRSRTRWWLRERFEPLCPPRWSSRSRP